MLKERIAQRQDVRIAVIGIGYVGLPLAVKMANMGFQVAGVDISSKIINRLMEGKSTIEMLSDTEVAEVILGTQKLKLVLVDRDSDDTSQAAIDSLLAVDVFIICVQTPLPPGGGWEPDLSWIEQSARLIQRVQEAWIERNRGKHKELLVVLESTSFPGTTRQKLSPLVNRLKEHGIQMYLAYSPERTNPGRPNSDAVQEGADPFKITRIVGAIDQASLEVAVTLYQDIFLKIRAVESLEAAEMVKLVENTFRFVSIGFANEMARIARGFNLNIWELISAAHTKEFGLKLCFPGLIGGHCIPIDPHYLGWAVRNQKQVANFIDVAERAHQDMKDEAVALILRLLNDQEKCAAGASILFFGVTYKKNIGDTRESAVIDIMKRMIGYRAKVFYWDPVRANGSAKEPLRLGLTTKDLSHLPNAANNGFKVTENSGSYYFEPSELMGAWSEIRERCLGGEFDCIVLGANHDDFKVAYLEFGNNNEGPVIADLCDAFLSSGKPDCPLKKQLDDVKKVLERQGKYRLLGFD